MFGEKGDRRSSEEAIKDLKRNPRPCPAAFTDNANVNTYPLPGGKGMVAMTEAVSGTFKVDLNTLGTLERVRYGKDGIKGDLTTAHPVVYPDGSIYNLFLDVRFRLHLQPVPGCEISAPSTTCSWM